jgi:hypothetical protein
MRWRVGINCKFPKPEYPVKKGATMSEQPVYNSPRFKPNDYNFEMFMGPRAGEDLKDFALTDLETGEPVKLSDFAGQWLMIETASSTCSMYTKNIPDMKELQDEFPDVTWLTIYVREAHPGERLGAHKNMEEKMEAARLVAPRYGEFRRVLVDNLEGDFHRAYGAMPNVAYIVRPDGKIHFRCNWAAPSMIKEALADRTKYHTYENADTMTLRASRKKMHMLRTMWTGGIVALYDFFKGAPFVISKHYKVDTYYAKYGRFINDPAERPSAEELAAIINEAEARAEAEKKGQAPAAQTSPQPGG